MFSFVTVRFPDSPLEPERIYSLEYRQKNYEHDFAKLLFRDWNVDPKRIKPGTAMEIILEDKTYSGYVHDIRPKVDNSSNFTQVSFIGASYVMRQASQAVYKNVTADEVIKKIAIKYGFSYKLEPHPRVYQQVSQAGLTDWEFMVKLAKQCGYFLRAESTSLYFQPLLQEFEETISEVQTFTQVDAGFKSFNPMYEFRAITGETLAHEGANKTAISVAGIDPITEKPFKYTKQVRSKTTRQNSQAELFDGHATKVVANTYEIAVSEANSADEKSKFPYKAEALVYGSAYLNPGMPVFLQTSSDEYTGYWTVLSLEHNVIEEKLNTQLFTTSLVLGTDSLGAASSQYPTTPPAKPYRTISPNIRNTRTKAKSVIKSSNLPVKPKNSVALVDRVNRPAPPGKFVAKTTWASDKSNLKSKPRTPGRSPAALNKVVSYLGR